MSTKEKYEQTKLSMVPIRDVVIFPFMMVPFVIGRESSVQALESALRGDKRPSRCRDLSSSTPPDFQIETDNSLLRRQSR